MENEQEILAPSSMTKYSMSDISENDHPRAKVTDESQLSEDEKCIDVQNIMHDTNAWSDDQAETVVQDDLGKGVSIVLAGYKRSSW